MNKVIEDYYRGKIEEEMKDHWEQIEEEMKERREQMEEEWQARQKQMEEELRDQLQKQLREQMYERDVQTATSLLNNGVSADMVAKSIPTLTHDFIVKLNEKVLSPSTT